MSSLTGGNMWGFDGRPAGTPAGNGAFLFGRSLADRIQGFVNMALYGPKPSEEFMLWINSVGGFWVCMAEEVVLGQPDERGSADVPILADISPRHARVRRDGENYLIEAIREVRLNGKPLRGVAALSDGSRIELGEAVKLDFRKTHPLSGTARLDFVSRHRTQPSADAVILMADTCVLGPRPHSHVVCRDWPREVILFRHDDRLFCRTEGAMTIDGAAGRNRGRLSCKSRVAGEGFAFSLEPME